MSFADDAGWFTFVCCTEGRREEVCDMTRSELCVIDADVRDAGPRDGRDEDCSDKLLSCEEKRGGGKCRGDGGGCASSW